MIYTKADFKRMETDPTFELQYLWFCGMNAKRISIELRRDAKKVGMDDNADMIKQAETLERFSSSIEEYVSKQKAPNHR